jgi:hypothetical protein
MIQPPHIQIRDSSSGEEEEAVKPSSDNMKREKAGKSSRSAVITKPAQSLDLMDLLS